MQLPIPFRQLLYCKLMPRLSLGVHATLLCLSQVSYTISVQYFDDGSSSTLEAQYDHDFQQVLLVQD